VGVSEGVYPASPCATAGDVFAIPKRTVAVARQTSGKRYCNVSGGDWLVQHFTLLGFTFQNWMVVILAMIVAAVLMARMENG
jgi:hypothetical protein